MTIDAFYRGLMQSMPNAIVSFLDEEASAYDFNVSLLIAGIDEEGAHLFDVTNPGGAFQDHEPIGFHAIGSGGFQAIQAMISFGHTGKKILAETLFHVYAAKRRAEVAPGVGKDTDMMVISASGIRWLTHDELQQLETIFSAWQRPLDEATKSAVAELAVVGETQ
jgi:20S proteasome alpha/beta subunit